MKLNADTIYYHLNQEYRLDYIHPDLAQKEFGRPRLYTPGAQLNDYLCLVPEDHSMLPAGTYVCLCMPCLSDPEHTTVFLLKEKYGVSELYNFLQSIFDFYDEWSDSCMQIVEEYQDFRSLIITTYQRMNTPLCLMDNQFSVVAAAQDPQSSYTLFGENGLIGLDTVNDLISNPHLRHLENREGEFDFDYDENYKVYNFHYHSRYCGRLILATDRLPDSGRSSLILNHLAEYIEYLLRRFGSFHSTSTAQTILRSFLSDALSGAVIHPQELKRLMQSTGWSDQHTYMIITFLPEHRLKKELYPPYLVSQIEELWQDACAVEYKGNVTMLINLSVHGEVNLNDFYQSLAYMVRDGLMIAGCSRPFNDLKDVSLFFQQASLAIEFGQKKDSTRWYFRFNDYSLDYLLNYGTGLFKAEQVCHPALLRLREHDQNRQTCYFETLYTYFKCQFNMSHAANELYIHRSTFINRMERIQELTKLNLNDYDTRLYLELSFRILDAPDHNLISQFYV